MAHRLNNDCNIVSIGKSTASSVGWQVVIECDKQSKSKQQVVMCRHLWELLDQWNGASADEYLNFIGIVSTGYGHVVSQFIEVLEDNNGVFLDR